MTADSTVFGQGTTPPDAAPASKTPDSGDSLVSAMVGEGKKYKSVEELAKAYANAEAFLETLKGENRELRQKVEKAATLESVMEQLKQTRQQPADTPVQGVPLTVDQVAEIVKQQVTGMETARTKAANLAKADAEMKKVYGDKALDAYKAVATTPELQKVYTELASVDPDRFLALFAPKSAPTGGVDKGTINSSGIGNLMDTKTEWSKNWVDEVRAKDPNRYWSSDFQYELQKQVTSNPKVYFGS